MSPSRSACPCRILKISSCLRSPPVPWTPRSLATALSSVMVLSLSSDRFILLPPAPPESDAAVSVASDFCGEGRLGLRCEMVISGGLNVYGELGSTSILNFPQRALPCQFKTPGRFEPIVSFKCGGPRMAPALAHGSRLGSPRPQACAREFVFAVAREGAQRRISMMALPRISVSHSWNLVSYFCLYRMSRIWLRACASC